MGRDPPAPNTKSDIIFQYVGCGGTAPSPSLELLGVATPMASSPRLESGAMALQRDPLYFYHGLLALFPHHPHLNAHLDLSV